MDERRRDWLECERFAFGMSPASRDVSAEETVELLADVLRRAASA